MARSFVSRSAILLLVLVGGCTNEPPSGSVDSSRPLDARADAPVDAAADRAVDRSSDTGVTPEVDAGAADRNAEDTAPDDAAGDSPADQREPDGPAADGAADSPLPDAADAPLAPDVPLAPPSCGPAGATRGWIGTISSEGSTIKPSDRAVWIGNGLFVYNGGDYNTNRRGAIWTRDTGIWKSVNLSGAPQSVDSFGLVWTGSRVVLWGGITTAGIVKLTSLGWLYDPAGDSWSAMSGDNPPAARQGPILLWSGTQVVVWDGTSSLASDTTSDFGELPGGMWDPGTATWAPIPREGGGGVGTRALWANDGLFLVGGSSELSSYGRHTFWMPPAAAWPTSCGLTSARRFASLVWTGTQAILWGGRSGDGSSVTPLTYDQTGLFLTPGNCTTTAISATVNTPSPRSHHSAVWTGSQMIVFGGNSGASSGVVYDDGASYDPALDQWAPLEPGNPGRRNKHQAFWTGSEMIVWGSAPAATAGCIYKP